MAFQTLGVVYGENLLPAVAAVLFHNQHPRLSISNCVSAGRACIDIYEKIRQVQRGSQISVHLRSGEASCAHLPVQS